MSEEIIKQEEKQEEQAIEKTPVEVEQNQNGWRDNVYGNVKMSVKTLDIVIGCMIGFIVLVLVVGAIKLFF